MFTPAKPAVTQQIIKRGVRYGSNDLVYIYDIQQTDDVKLLENLFVGGCKSLYVRNRLAKAGDEESFLDVVYTPPNFQLSGIPITQTVNCQNIKHLAEQSANLVSEFSGKYIDCVLVEVPDDGDVQVINNVMMGTSFYIFKGKIIGNAKHHFDMNTCQSVLMDWPNILYVNSKIFLDFWDYTPKIFKVVILNEKQDNECKRFGFVYKIKIAQEDF